MKKILLLSICLLIAVLSATAQSADDIIAKHVNAIGGREKLKAINTMKATGTVDVGGGLQIPYTNYYKRPDMMKIEATFQGMTQQIAVEGDKGWQVNPFMGSKDPEPMNADDLKTFRQQADFEGHLVDYKSKGYTAEYLGTEDFEGTQVHKIKLEGHGDIINYYLDAESNLLLKEVQKFKLSDTEIETETIYGDYKDESGVMMPHSMENKTPGQQGTMKITVSTIEVNVPVNDSIFIMPPKAAEIQK